MAGPARVVIQVIGDSRSAVKAFNETQDAYSKMSRGLATAGRALTVGITAPLAAAAAVGISELLRTGKVAAQTASVIRSTGQAANVTAKDVDRLATSLMNKSGADDETIASGANLLLTFTNIRNEAGRGNRIFDQATKAALDLSVALGSDMQSASLMLGKALNDPIAGMTALGRAGVQFTADQKKVIKTMVETGDVLGAQKLILAEVNKQVGGSAKAYGETLAGQIDIARETFRNASGTLMTLFVPAIKAVASVVGTVSTALQELPAPARDAVTGLLAVAASTGPLLLITSKLMTAYKDLAPTIAKAVNAMKAMNLAQLGMIGGIGLLAGAVVAVTLALRNQPSAFERANTAAARWIQTVTSAAQASGEPIRFLKNEILATEAAFNKAKAAQGESSDAALRQVARFEELTDALTTARAAQKTAEAADKEREASLARVAGGTLAARDATDEAKQSLQEYSNLQLSLQGGVIGLTAAQLNAQKAQLELDKVRGDSEATALDLAAAENDVKQANLAVAQAAIKLTEDTDKWNQLTKDEQLATLTEQKRKLEETRAAYGDASGAIGAQITKIDELITKTKQIKQPDPIILDVDTAAAQRELETFLRQFSDIDLIYNPGSIVGPSAALAAVPRVARTSTGMRAAPTPMVGARAAPAPVTINVTAGGLGADAPEIQRAVVRALQAHSRRNGPLDLQIRS